MAFTRWALSVQHPRGTSPLCVWCPPCYDDTTVAPRWSHGSVYAGNDFKSKDNGTTYKSWKQLPSFLYYAFSLGTWMGAYVHSHLPWIIKVHLLMMQTPFPLPETTGLCSTPVWALQSHARELQPSAPSATGHWWVESFFPLFLPCHGSADPA